MEIENKSDMFFLSPKNQDRMIKIMDKLESQGYPANNQTMTTVLHAMREKGFILKTDDKEILNLIKKVVPKDGKILYIKEDRHEKI